MPHLHYSVRETCSEQGNSFPNTKQVNGSARMRTSLSYIVFLRQKLFILTRLSELRNGIVCVHTVNLTLGKENFR